MSNAYPAAYNQQWFPVQTGMPQGPGPWQQGPPPPPVIVPPAQAGFTGIGYVPPRKSRNLVNQVKALLTQASAGQLLDIAKHASAELRSKNPHLHLELVKAVTGGAAGPQAQARGPQVGDSLEISRRKAIWREKCEKDSAVAYRDSVITEVQRSHGTKVAVDDLVCELPNVDLKRYLLGKKRREALLSESGLAREGVELILLPEWVDSSCQDSLNGDGQSDDEKVQPVTREDISAMQAAIASLTMSLGQLMERGTLPPTPVAAVKQPPAAPSAGDSNRGNSESKEPGGKKT